MAGDTTITIVGNLTADPELRFTPSGAAVANFTVASTPRIYDRQTGEWKDGEALFLRCNIWREAAENVAESLTRGARVIVSGRLKQRSFETREGEKRTVIEVEVDEIGPSLRYATAKVNKASRSGGLAADPVRRRRRPAAPREMTRGAAHRRRVRSAAAMTNRHSDPKNCKSRNGKIDTHGQVQQAAPGSGKAGQDA
ncbi:single-stranded DNA-binding protein [Mycobacterium tuberculosis]|uniref:single-stranded DNA-binding protein n=2 Tax=Mycobacterium tuberculosis TaxID=1773 RepID=UPI0005DDDF3C|nr:single-stranded DNA-binding protein [Mycobacterium tuberculosis]CMQ83873.1 single-stranded DNA-binding protein [Mycobacterium tuberculosis]